MLGEPGPLLLSAPQDPDYEIHPLAEQAALPAPVADSDSAMRALDEMEMTAQISEYHDFSWWDERIRIVRAAIAKSSR